jgi:hypothetical protein
LVFVLSCNIPPWNRLMQASMDTWDSEATPNVQTVYYHGYPHGEANSKVLQLPIPEGYYAINGKNMAAFSESLHWQWDYMARVNASCYVHKGRLLKHVQSLPDTGVFQCVLADPTPNCGTTQKWPWGGMQFIFSRDVVASMVANSGHLRHDMMEDAALGELARLSGYQLDGSGMGCSINRNGEGWFTVAYNKGENQTFTIFGDIPHHYFFRVKCDSDRSVDEYIMRQLKQHLK